MLKLINILAKNILKKMTMMTFYIHVRA